MRAEYEASYSSKFDHPFTAYLYELALNGGADEDSGDSEAPTGWFARLGRHIITEDGYGFVWHHRADSIDQARTFFAELDDEYGAWLGDEDIDWPEGATTIVHDCGGAEVCYCGADRAAALAQDIARADRGGEM